MAIDFLITFFLLMMVFTGIKPAANDGVISTLKFGALKLQKEMQTLVDQNLGYNILQVNHILLHIISF